MSQHNNSPIILTDKASVSEQFMRERAARQRLAELRTLQPTDPYLLTDEDAAIFGMFLQQNPDRFTLYVQSSLMEYEHFFVLAVGRAAGEELEKFS